MTWTLHQLTPEEIASEPTEIQIKMALFEAAEPLYHCVELAIENIEQKEIERVLSILILMKSHLSQYTGRDNDDEE